MNLASAHFAIAQSTAAAFAAAGFACGCAKGFIAVQSIHSVATSLSQGLKQQFKTLYKTSGIVSASKAVALFPRYIHEA